jgi:hypothetical protein
VLLADTPVKSAVEAMTVALVMRTFGREADTIPLQISAGVGSEPPHPLSAAKPPDKTIAAANRVLLGFLFICPMLYFLSNL